MKVKMNKLLAFLVAVIMLIGLLPLGALAIKMEGGKYEGGLIFEYHLTSTAMEEIKTHYNITSDISGATLNFTRHDSRGMSWNLAYDQLSASFSGTDWIEMADPETIATLTVYFKDDQSIDISSNNLKCVYYSPGTENFYELMLDSSSFPPPVAKIYTVTFDANGGEPTPTAQSITDGETAVSPTPAPEKDGYSLLGWYAQGAQDPFDFSTPITGALTLIAQWQPAPSSYTMFLEYHYNNNGNGNGDPVSAAVLTETAKALAIDGVTYTVADGRINLTISKSALSENKQFDYSKFVFETLSDGATLTNKVPDNNTWISFNKNGAATETPKLLYKKAPVVPQHNAWFFIRTDGLIPLETGTSGYPNSNYVPNHDSSVLVPLQGLVDTNTAHISDLSGLVSDKDFYTADQLKDFFAPVTSHVLTPPDDSAIQVALKGTGISYAPENQFLLWYVIKPYSPGHISTCPGIHVDGVVIENSENYCTLTYKLNPPTDAGTDKPLSVTPYKQGAEARVGSWNLTLANYTFTGWNSAADGKGTSYPTGSTITMDTSKILYAQWKIKTYDVTYSWADAPAGQVLPAPATVNHGGSHTVDTSFTANTKIFADDGTYTFSGWNKTGVITNITAPVTLTGTWTFVKDPEPISHAVSYEWTGAPKSGVTLPTGTTVSDGATYTVDTTYAKDHTIKLDGGTYTFSGWDKTGEITNITAPVVLTGKWTFAKDEVPPATYAVTYQYTGTVPTGMTPPVDSAKYEAGAQVTLAVAPAAPANYTFHGWTLSGELTAIDGKFTMPEGAVTVTGNWTYTTPGGGGDPTPNYTVTVNYLAQGTNAVLAPAYSASMASGSRYDVSAQASLAITDYAIASTSGAVSGTLNNNVTINVYYTADTTIPDENPPLGPGPGDGGTTIPDENVPTAPGPDDGTSIPDENVPTAPGPDDNTVITDGEVPLGNLPQTGTAAPVDASLTLGLLALAASMAAAGLTFTLFRKKEEEI